jgi:hypothetical protein
MSPNGMTSNSNRLYCVLKAVFEGVGGVNAKSVITECKVKFRIN